MPEPQTLNPKMPQNTLETPKHSNFQTQIRQPRGIHLREFQERDAGGLAAASEIQDPCGALGFGFGEQGLVRFAGPRTSLKPHAPEFPKTPPLLSRRTWPYCSPYLCSFEAGSTLGQLRRQVGVLATKVWSLCRAPILSAETLLTRSGKVHAEDLQ